MSAILADNRESEVLFSKTKVATKAAQLHLGGLEVELVRGGDGGPFSQLVLRLEELLFESGLPRRRCAVQVLILPVRKANQQGTAELRRPKSTHLASAEICRVKLAFVEAYALKASSFC